MGRDLPPTPTDEAGADDRFPDSTKSARLPALALWHLSTTRKDEAMLKDVNSAVKSVRCSGLELVPRRKRTGKLATERDFAKLDWKPWKHPPDLSPSELLPSHETMETVSITARIAYSIMLKSREELIEMHKAIEHEVMDELMGKLAQATEDFKALASICDQAYAHILAAGSRHAVSGGKFKFKETV
jgi:hypothetical protein